MAYFVIHNDEQSGPHQADEIKSRMDSGELELTDLCWREGWRQWRPIGSVAAFAPVDAFAKSPGNGDELAEPLEDRWTHRRHAASSWAIGLAVLLIFSVAGAAVLWVLLAEARARILALEEAGAGRESIERVMDTRIFEIRTPVPAEEIKVWMTYLDPVTKRPVPVSRGTVLLYPAQAVEAPLEALRQRPPGPAASLMEAVQGALPAPSRETITDSEGFAVFSEVPAGDYVVVAFTMKAAEAGESPYLWIAQCRLDGQPHATLILSETNAAGSSSSLEVIGAGVPEAP